MRTTVTLDPDVEALVKRAMRERGLTFKQAVNEAIRAGMGGPPDAAAADFPTYDMGEPLVDITKALRLAGELEDQELTARLARGS
ncbi:MAG: antitoxin [Thermoleophilaceae bacterium]